MPSLKLIAVDIDGTLLGSSFRVSEANVRALSEAHQARIHVVLATGRRHAFALPIARLLGFEPFIISSNGAVSRDPAGALISKTLMPREIARAVLDHMQNWTNAAVLTFDRELQGALVIQSRAELIELIARWVEGNTQYIVEVNPIQDSLTEDPIQTMFCGTIAQMDQAIRHLDSAPISKAVSVHVTQYDDRNLSIFDVLPLGCTKGSALEALCTKLNIGREDVLAIGDNYNDREMLAFAGHPFVVANAHAEMKNQGWRVTLSNDEDGVAHAVASALEPAVRA
jgi:Cof subfamily protein (haloacid dehalogenase superfamily)